MSRTIRRKGWHLVKSSKWNDQNNNKFAYIEKRNYNNPQDVLKKIEENLKRSDESKLVIAKSKRDGFWKTERWSRYVLPIPRMCHKMEIKRSLKMDDDYIWDEKSARTYEKGLCKLWWD